MPDLLFYCCAKAYGDLCLRQGDYDKYKGIYGELGNNYLDSPIKALESLSSSSSCEIKVVSNNLY